MHCCSLFRCHTFSIKLFPFQHFFETLITRATFNTFVLLYAALHFADQPAPFLMLASYLRGCRAPLKAKWKSLRIPIEMSRRVPTITFDLFLMEYISSYISIKKRTITQQSLLKSVLSVFYIRDMAENIF